MPRRRHDHTSADRGILDDGVCWLPGWPATASTRKALPPFSLPNARMGGRRTGPQARVGPRVSAELLAWSACLPRPSSHGMNSSSRVKGARSVWRRRGETRRVSQEAHGKKRTTTAGSAEAHGDGGVGSGARRRRGRQTRTTTAGTGGSALSKHFKHSCTTILYIGPRIGRGASRMRRPRRRACP